MIDQKFKISSLLSIHTGAMDPNGVTDALGLDPFKIYLKGLPQPVGKDVQGTPPNAKRNVWSFRIGYENHKSLSDHLNRYVELIRPRSQEFRSVRERFGEIKLIVRISERGAWPAIELCPEFMTVLGEAEIYLDFDLLH